MKRYQNPFLVLLLCGVFAQALLVIGHTRDAEEPFAAAPAVLVGDTLATLSGQLPDGTSTVVPLTADPGTMTVLYSFHPECEHCDTVAPVWASHFASADPTVRRIAVTADLHEPAVTYAARFGWSVDLLSVSQLGLTDREYSLVSRTPWLFAFDWNGVLRFQGHGSELDRVKQVVAAMAAGGKRHVVGGTE
ncbi:MAG: hypothetical protein F4Z31_13600 [Gemmatimonadetes bacterium]|nr:hypothetical protein [Gemmatimonadota bacterium]MYA42771.1 hypothetical protein [Gemmatimonadota bacterium]MYE94789.1 hypothetical protein [Gemmatimonadota bacterium]MYJ10828.1 hypothetical protein [Gemmatimonadota bacterium]